MVVSDEEVLVDEGTTQVKNNKFHSQMCSQTNVINNIEIYGAYAQFNVQATKCWDV